MKMETKVAEDVAISDVKDFVNFYQTKETPLEEIIEEYPDVVLAVQWGLLTFDENKTPILVLKDPLKTESGTVVKDSITFKTRIVASVQANLARGIDIKKDTYTFLNKLKAYYIGEPVAMLDKIGKFDLDVITQVTSVF